MIDIAMGDTKSGKTPLCGTRGIDNAEFCQRVPTSRKGLVCQSKRHTAEEKWARYLLWQCSREYAQHKFEYWEIWIAETSRMSLFASVRGFPRETTAGGRAGGLVGRGPPV